MISKEALNSVEKLEYSKMLQGSPVSLEREGFHPIHPSKIVYFEKYVIPMKFSRLALKVAISIPFLTAWLYWLIRPAEIPMKVIQMPVYITIVGYISVFMWLLICSFNNLAIVLKVGTYYMFGFVPLCFGSLFCSIHSGSLAIGILLGTGGVLAFLDVLLYFLLFPPIKRVSVQSVSPVKEPLSEVSADYYRPVGDLFEYIPLKGGPRVPLRSYSDVALIGTKSSEEARKKEPSVHSTGNDESSPETDEPTTGSTRPRTDSNEQVETSEMPSTSKQLNEDNTNDD